MVLRDTATGGAHLAFGAAGAPALVAHDDSAPTFAPPARACAGSLVTARMTAREWHAAWWQADAEGNAALATARSTDGGEQWSAPVIADARDRSGEGCTRPPPSIATDSVTGYVHLAYFLRPAEGAGVWYTHSMDRGASWHSTAAMIYGDDPARTAVGVAGALLVVAYESPNARVRRVGVALSRSAGHSFGERLRASGGDVAATHPLAAVRGRAFAVGWSEPAGRIVGRVGVVRD
ncbi:MAG: sialidase family protein [Gemmatimonadaceae bacterium]